MMSWTLTQIFESSMWWYNAIFDWATLLWDQNSCLIDSRESLNWEFWNPSGYKMVAPIRSSVPWRQRLGIRDLGPSTVLAQSRCSIDICRINVCCRRTQEFSSRQEIPFSWCFAWISVTSWTSWPMHRKLHPLWSWTSVKWSRIIQETIQAICTLVPQNPISMERLVPGTKIHGCLSPSFK